MSLRVIPAYRVVTKFAEEARGLPFEEAVDAMEGDLEAEPDDEAKELAEKIAAMTDEQRAALRALLA